MLLSVTISLDAIERLKSEGTVNRLRITQVFIGTSSIQQIKLCQTLNIRKALTLAIDREGLIKNITKGEQQPALGIVPNSVEGFGEDEGYFKDADFEACKSSI